MEFPTVLLLAELGVEYTAWGQKTRQYPVGDVNAILENTKIGGLCVHHKRDLS